MRLVDMGRRQSRAEDAITVAVALVSGTAMPTLWTNQDQDDQAETLWLPFILNASEHR
jgi:hypothetical protein